MQSGLRDGGWGSPQFSQGCGGNAELLPGCAQKQIIQLLRMQPSRLSQPEHLIFYRLNVCKLAQALEEHPQGQEGIEEVSLWLRDAVSGEGRAAAGKWEGSHYEMTSPFFFSPSLFPCWFQMAERSPPPEDGSLY